MSIFLLLFQTFLQIPHFLPVVSAFSSSKTEGILRVEDSAKFRDPAGLPLVRRSVGSNKSIAGC
ncbi:hypothetical protein PsorP6_013634 [Peronosclerospora sorghi]|uniref:Uncharacterized protein n=1 Tax=Peronosclerospora sorghi TaxID=230839 RepID=A0ACC0VJ53_9STRA|nr:hypothetical protein PsorP6_013634 [Peronosclerospora sorghi]